MRRHAPMLHPAWGLPVAIAAFAALIVAVMGGTIAETGAWYHGLVQPRWAPTDLGTGKDKDPSKEAGTYHAAVKALFEKTATAATGGESAKADVLEAQNDLAAFMSQTQDIDMEKWRTDADLLRRGEKGVAESTMTNFRLMRCTSSYFHQYSSVKFNETGDGKMEVDPNSRCGLPLGQNNDDANNVTASYIIGAWCIGTVLDNAASRSTVGHLVRIAPASMAINVNVNIEWWSGDKLYRNYMDVNGEVQRRGEFTKAGQPSAARAAGLDLSLADLEEALPWVPYGKKDPEAEEEEEEVV